MREAENAPEEHIINNKKSEKNISAPEECFITCQEQLRRNNLFIG